MAVRARLTGCSPRALSLSIVVRGGGGCGGGGGEGGGGQGGGIGGGCGGGCGGGGMAVVRMLEIFITAELRSHLPPQRVEPAS